MDAITQHERDVQDLREARAMVRRLERIAVGAMNTLRAIDPEAAERLEAAICATA
jgi:cob(I)alamin adenosyltransferase